LRVPIAERESSADSEIFGSSTLLRHSAAVKGNQRPPGFTWSLTTGVTAVGEYPWGVAMFVGKRPEQL
jgi:hypothetical protein